MEEKKNIPTVEGEAITPEAPAADIPGTDAPSPDLTAGAPPQEQAGVTVSEPGDVVVSFDKIEELMAERRAAARDTVEQAEPAAPEVAAPVVEQAEPPTPEAPAPSQPEKATEQAPEEKPQDEVAAEQKKPRRGRPPKAEKAEQAAPEADKEQTAAKPRRGRPPKADKAAPDEAQPPKPRDKVSQGKKAATVKAAPAPEQATAGGGAGPEAGIAAEPQTPTPPPRPVEEGKLVYKAFYSLDCNDGIENAAIGWAQPSPEDYLIEKEELAEYEELIRRLYEAISSLPPMQARRVHARYMLGMKVKDIAAMEGITPSQAGKSIHAALRRLRRYFARQKWTVNL